MFPFSELSIGVGGHINPEDLAGQPADAGIRPDPVSAASRREVAEELDVRGDYALRPVGILNDDSNPVGAVHLGLVQVLTVDGTVSIREKDVLEGQLVPPDELARQLAHGANFESWSALLIDRLDELLPNTLPALS